MSIDTSNIKVSVKTKKPGSSTLAIANIIIDDVHRIKGFTVHLRKLDGNYFVYPPRKQKDNKKWEFYYYCENPELWKELETKIVEEFNNQVFKESLQT